MRKINKRSQPLLQQPVSRVHRRDRVVRCAVHEYVLLQPGRNIRPTQCRLLICKRHQQTVACTVVHSFQASREVPRNPICQSRICQQRIHGNAAVVSGGFVSPPSQSYPRLHSRDSRLTYRLGHSRLVSFVWTEGLVQIQMVDHSSFSPSRTYHPYLQAPPTKCACTFCGTLI